MSKMIVSRVIENKNKSNGKFAVPNLIKLMKMFVNVNDEIILPISYRKNEHCFWESGGRDDRYESSIGTVIASNEDGLLDAILFNKINKGRNSKQALICLNKGCHLYVGRLNIRRKAIVPDIKIFRLVYTGTDDELSEETDYDVTYGRFVVDEIFTSYSDTEGCVPCERLIEKLITKDVTRAYYVNGWSTTDISSINDKGILHDAYMRLLSDDTDAENSVTGNDFLDSVEEYLVRLDNKKLSATFQWIDFNSNIMGIKPLKDVELSNLLATIGNAKVHSSFTVPLDVMVNSYNSRLLFDSDDIATIRFSLKHDDKYSFEVSENVFCLLRGFRG